jgi:flagellar protein FliS
MQMTTEATYRNCSVGGASPMGLMIALFDALVRDLRRAAEAIHREEVETRCHELNHALLVIGQLENWVDKQNGGEPARKLSALYSYLRAKMMEASIRKSAALLEAQMETVLHIRSKWQLLDLSPAPPDKAQETAIASGYGQGIPAPEGEQDRVPFSLSA